MFGDVTPFGGLRSYMRPVSWEKGHRRRGRVDDGPRGPGDREETREALTAHREAVRAEKKAKREAEARGFEKPADAAYRTLQTMYDETGEPIKAVDLASRIMAEYGVSESEAKRAFTKRDPSNWAFDVEYNDGSYTPN